MAELSRKKHLFGGEVEFTLFDLDPLLAEDIFGRLYAEALRLQKIFNLYDATSELNQLNSRRSLDASKELATVLKQALLLSEKTQGRYDVTKGKAFLARKAGKEYEVSCSFRDVTIKGNHILLDHPDILIDLGSIAKGFIVDRLIAFLKREGVLAAMIDARGDIRAYGKKITIDIQHPRADKIIGSVILDDAAIATSGDYKQYHDNHDRSHILGKGDLISATVLAPTLMEADMLATALLVKDDLMLKKEVKALTVNKQLAVKTSASFELLVNAEVP